MGCVGWPTEWILAEQCGAGKTVAGQFTQPQRSDLVSLDLVDLATVEHGLSKL